MTIHESDSLTWLKQCAGPKIDGFYAHSPDSDQPGHAEHGLREAELAPPHPAEDAIILIDGTPRRKGECHGKGRLAVEGLIEKGFKVKYAGLSNPSRPVIIGGASRPASPPP